MAEISAQVCYARPDLQILRELKIAEGATLRAAVEQSGILVQLPDIDIDNCRVGVFGKLKTLDTVLRDHDRVELYRPLIADPKESRRKRAEKRAEEKAR
ncbi:MAG TPA: RnfH family protein [Noviherbaspirillum sp.]|nr:RnfH family protein [Noviherbaspirillum sp.]